MQCLSASVEHLRQGDAASDLKSHGQCTARTPCIALPDMLRRRVPSRPLLLCIQHPWEQETNAEGSCMDMLRVHAEYITQSVIPHLLVHLARHNNALYK
jgi:hypothetical protein